MKNVMDMDEKHVVLAVVPGLRGRDEVVLCGRDEVVLGLLSQDM